MNWYKIATVLEDIPYPPDWDADIKEVIETLHELELKSHFIETMPEFSGVNPRRKENVQERIREISWSYFEFCKDKIERIFDYWKSQHRIQDADAFAEMTIDEMRENISSDDEEIIKYCLKNGLRRGMVHVNPDQLKDHVDKERVAEIIREDFRNDYDAYEYSIESYLNENVPEWEDEGMKAEEYMVEHGLEDQIEDYTVENADYDDESYGFTMQDLEKAIKETLYVDYMMTFGGSVETVHDEIDEAVKRMDDVPPDDTVSIMAMAISLSLNVMHVNGNIMTDYGDGEITQGFLDYIQEGSPHEEEWKEETKEQFFGVKPKSVGYQNFEQPEFVLSARTKTAQYYKDVLKNPDEYEDVEQWKAAQYFSIGQEDETSEKSYWWAWDGNMLHVKKGPTTHSMAFGTRVNDLGWIKGVYDPVQNFCSISLPRKTYERQETKTSADIPDNVSTALRNEFGDKFRFVVF